MRHDEFSADECNEIGIFGWAQRGRVQSDRICLVSSALMSLVGRVQSDELSAGELSACAFGRTNSARMDSAPMSSARANSAPSDSRPEAANHAIERRSQSLTSLTAH